MATDKVLYRPRLHRIQREDVIVLIDPETPNWAAVNKEGCRILDLCDGEQTLEDIAGSLSGSFSKDEVYGFIEDAIKREIISTRPPSTVPYQGRSAYLAPETLEELWVYVTNDCNLRCLHCLVRGGEDVKPELSTDELKQIIKDASNLGVRRVFFTGGEPFLRADLFDLIEYVTRELKIELVILTNGSLLDRERVNKLQNLPNLLIQVSLEGPNAGVNDAIRGKGSFKKTLKSVELLIDSGVMTTVTSTATRKNILSIPELSDLLHEKNARTHHILWVHKRGRARENRMAVESREVLELMHELKGKKTRIDNWENLKSRVSMGRGTKIDGCHAGFSSLCIDSNGDVYPCPSLNGENRFSMGNVREGLEKIWKRPISKDDLRRISVIDIPGCSDCEFRFLCGGGCRCQAYFAGEKPDIRAKDPYCEVTKSMLVECILSLVGPNGSGRPEFLGHMQDCGPRCEPTGTFPKKVVPFHCSCVLDLASEKQDLTKARYREAALQPQEELCCPTGYSSFDLEHIPRGTIGISYGCGNPTAFSDLVEGESVLDLGSGGGIDCFIAAQKVGSTGRVIGVDMTEEMLGKAEENKVKMAEVLGYDVVEFRKGFLEDLPVEDTSIDLVISNCVINLSPDKNQAFNEIFRVLKPGGRFSISDIVSDKGVPTEMKEDAELWSGCISGALTQDEFLEGLSDAGFKNVAVENSHCWKVVEGIVFSSVTVRGKKGLTLLDNIW